ncbi:LPS export ABC transporter periplasmic protein LptC [Gammaproteobacteria bacterium 2W06]|nr:LPS export ABC transporter periplasmic protein LptC [Gammaproteobacteria bacterium 2W06]
MRRRVVMLLALALAALLGWRLFGAGGDPDAVRTVTDPRLDAYARTVTLTTTNADGAISWRVRSPDARHNPREGSWRLASPDWRVETDRGPPWRGRSNHGWIGDDDTRARLRGDVVMTRQTAEGRTRLTTQRLDARIPERYAETDQPVTMTRPGLRVDAVGARVWFAQERLELLDDVEGVYDAASP